MLNPTTIAHNEKIIIILLLKIIPKACTFRIYFIKTQSLIIN